MGKIKDLTTGKAIDINNRLSDEAKSRYIHWVAKEENCSVSEAIDICTGQTDPVQDEYVIGYMTSDVSVLMGLYLSGKKQRDLYARQLESKMTESQIAIFREKVLTESAAKMFKEKLKKGKKGKE